MPDGVLSEDVSAGGIAAVREVPAPGMIALKADLGAPACAEALRAATGCPVPERRAIVTEGKCGVAWMAPDEVLILVPRERVAAALADLSANLGDRHFLAADVSDMRAMFRVEGAGAREVLAKLAPVDLAPGRFGPGEIRRTRLAQIPAAFWMDGDAIVLVCFRSVAQYAFDVLSGAAAEGGAVGHFA